MRTIKLLALLIAATSIAMVAKNGFKPPKITVKVLDKNYRKFLKKDLTYYNAAEGESFYTVMDDDDKAMDLFTEFDGNSLKAKKSFKIPLKKREKGQKLFRTRYIFLKDYVVQIYSYYDNKANKFNVYGQKYDLKGKKQGKTVNMGSFKSDKKSNIGQVIFAISPGKTKIAVYRNPPDGRFEEEELEILLFNNDLEKIYSRKLKVSSASMLADINSLSVNDSGKIFLAAQEYKVKNPAKKKQKRELSSSEFRLYTIDIDSEVLEEIKIKNKNKFIFSVNTLLDQENNKLILSGFHNDISNESKKDKRKSSYGFNGVYYISLDLDNWEIITEKFADIDKADLDKIATASITSEKKKAKAEKKLANKEVSFGSNYKTRSLWVKKNKDLVIVMENAYIVERCQTDSRTGITTCVYYYYNMAIIEFHINEEGNMKRVGIIPKKQVTAGNDFFNGFVTILDENEDLVHLYNDNFLNYNKKKMAKYNDPFRFYFTTSRSIKKPKWMLTSVKSAAPEETGRKSKTKKDEIEKKQFYDSHKNTIIILPRYGVKINNGAFVCSYYQRKPQAFGMTLFSYGSNR